MLAFGRYKCKRPSPPRETSDGKDGVVPEGARADCQLSVATIDVRELFGTYWIELLYDETDASSNDASTSGQRALWPASTSSLRSVCDGERLTSNFLSKRIGPMPRARSSFRRLRLEHQWQGRPFRNSGSARRSKRIIGKAAEFVVRLASDHHLRREQLAENGSGTRRKSACLVRRQRTGPMGSDEAGPS